jgi:hypothetical protein
MGPINLPEIVAEVAACLDCYEDALVNNRVEVLDKLFFDSPETVRYGAGEALYGIEEIRTFRKARPSAGLTRTVVRTAITTFGTDFAVTHREFLRVGNPKPGRQTQTWVRTDAGWKVVSAHVSQSL